jgi:hypothetical protein
MKFGEEYKKLVENLNLPERECFSRGGDSRNFGYGWRKKPRN